MEIIAHLDEIFLKGNNQRVFIRRLSDNLQKLFKGAAVRRAESGGLLVSGMGEGDLSRLVNVPGIANFAPVILCKNGIEDIKDSIDKLSFPSSIKTFRISAVRSDKSYPKSSKQIEIELGDLVRKIRGWGVNLSEPDADIRVEVGRGEARVYNNVIAGAGGLPTGSSGKVLCLISGGIDSPVAAYQMMKRGAEVLLAHFQNETKVTEEVSQKIIDLARVLAGYQPGVKLFIVPFAGLQKQVVMKVPAKHRMLITRRLMFKISERLARQENCLALATGDCLGQVASQTLENLDAVYEATDMLKLAPLMGSNKSEIVKTARHIGTLEISERPYEDCCSLFVARHPETRARLKDILEIEKAAGLSTTPFDRKKVISYHISIHY